MRPIVRVVTLSLAAAAIAAPGAAQVERGDPVPLSQYATVQQAVAWASLDVEYRRPVARGRQLFGQLVPWDEVWTPAADSAAVLTTTAPLEVGGRNVPAGSYSIWMIPRESGPWTLILSRQARVFHAPYPGADHDEIRIDLPTREGDHIESVLFAFAWAEGPRTELQFRWGTTVLPIPITVR